MIIPTVLAKLTQRTKRSRIRRKEGNMNEKQKEQARLRKQKQRDIIKENSVTSNTVTLDSVTLLNRPNGEPYNPDEIWEGQPRYVGPFSDGQVLDRKTVPLPAFNPPVGGFIPNKVGVGAGVKPADNWKVNGNA